MNYYTEGKGTIIFNEKVNKEELVEFLKNVKPDFYNYFKSWCFDAATNTLEVWTSDNYLEPEEVLNLLSQKFSTLDGSEISYTGEDNSLWKIKLDAVSAQWKKEEVGTVTYADERVIDLMGFFGHTLVRTNAPEHIIQEALNYRDDCIFSGKKIFSDFEMIQNYIYDKNSQYVFKLIGDLDEIESYHW